MAWFKENFPDKKVRRRIFILIAFLLIALFLILRLAQDQIMVRAGSCLFKAKVADTAKLQYQGLSNQADLCSDCALLFLFSKKEELSFVMRNMNFPLDIIFIADKKILNIHKQAPPEASQPQKLYRSAGPADAVLEINAGQADKCGLKVGDLITWSK